MTGPILDPFARRARAVPGRPPHDGDSVWLETDGAYTSRAEPDLRLDACWMPELKDPGGPQMRQVAVDWFAAAPRITWPYWVESVHTKVREPGQRRTLSRYLATVWHFDGQRKVGPSLNDVLNAALAEHPEWGHGKGRPS